MMLHFTNTIIEDIEDLIESGIDEGSPIINDYLAKHLIIAFSSEVEKHLKILLERKIRALPEGQIFKYCRMCNKIRNPKYKDIRSFLKDLSIPQPDLTDDQKTIYTNVIKNRDTIAHDIQATVDYTFQQIKIAVNVAEIILESLYCTE